MAMDLGKLSDVELKAEAMRCEDPSDLRDMQDYAARVEAELLRRRAVECEKQRGG